MAVPRGLSLAHCCGIYVGYDCVLEETEKKGITSYAYADDTQLLVSANSKEELVQRKKEAIEVVGQKIATLNLELNKSKTEIVVLGNIIRTDPIQITGDTWEYCYHLQGMDEVPWGEN